MKKLLLSLIILITIIFSTYAQKTQWGIKAGGGISNRSGFGKDLGLEVSPLPTLQGAVFGIVPLAESFVMQPSLGYCGKGNQIKNLLFTDELGNDVGEGTGVTRFDYIVLSAPFQFKAPLKNDVVIFSGLGPYLGFAASGVAKAKHVSNGTAPEKQKIDFENDNVRRFDAGVSLLMSFLLQKKWVISVSYDQGFVNTIKQGPIKSLNMYSGITVGYIFK